MKAKDLLAIVERRGLTLTISNGQPVIRGDKKKMTPAIVEALKMHRFEMLQHLGLAIPVDPPGVQEQVIELLWPGNDYVSKHWFPEVGFPVGAYFYRQSGSQEWLPIPGRMWDKDRKRGTVEKRDGTRPDDLLLRAGAGGHLRLHLPEVLGVQGTPGEIVQAEGT